MGEIASARRQRLAIRRRVPDQGPPRSADRDRPAQEPYLGVFQFEVARPEHAQMTRLVRSLDAIPEGKGKISRQTRIYFGYRCRGEERRIHIIKLALKQGSNWQD